MKPKIKLALGISLLSLSIATPALAKPLCWQVNPRVRADDQVSWHYRGKALLMTPKSWDVERAYAELESYGYCTIEPIPAATKPAQPAAPSTEPADKSEQDISNLSLIEQRALAARQGSPKTDSDSDGSGSFIVLMIALAFGFWVHDRRDQKQHQQRFYQPSPAYEEHPWDTDFKSPPNPSPDTHLVAILPVTQRQAFVPKNAEPPGIDEFSSEVQDDPNSGSDMVFTISQEEALKVFREPEFYDVFDDDCFLKAAIRVGISAKLTKEQIQARFIWLKEEGSIIHRSPVTKGGNKAYQRFTNLYNQVI